MVGQVGSEESAPAELLRGANQTGSEGSAEPQEARLPLKVADQAGEGYKVQTRTCFYDAVRKQNICKTGFYLLCFTSFLPGAIVLSLL